jgi:hypothetical protein
MVICKSISPEVEIAKGYDEKQKKESPAGFKLTPIHDQPAKNQHGQR